MKSLKSELKKFKILKGKMEINYNSRVILVVKHNFYKKLKRKYFVLVLDHSYSIIEKIIQLSSCKNSTLFGLLKKCLNLSIAKSLYLTIFFLSIFCLTFFYTNDFFN